MDISKLRKQLRFHKGGINIDNFKKLKKCF